MTSNSNSPNGGSVNGGGYTPGAGYRQAPSGHPQMAFDPNSQKTDAIEQRRRPGWQFAANEWADLATSGIAWLQNIKNGIATADEALAHMSERMEHCKAVRDAAHDSEIISYAGAPIAVGDAAQSRETTGDEAVEAFLNEVRAELYRARANFPGDRIMTIALAEEFGELCTAILDEPAASARKEAIQTAVMAARVAIDGDGSVNEWRAAKGLDPLTSASVGR